MNMNDNYLWDRTGEPDAEIQELEELLGTLRYEPKPLAIPATAHLKPRRVFIPLTIAAAIALLVIGAGLWIRFANSSQRPTQQATVEPHSVAPQATPPAPKEQLVISTPPESNEISHDRRGPKQNLVALKPRHSLQPPAPALTPAELAQKEQVMVALRLVSVKLNLAQRRAQGLPPVNAIRNHKIG
jgi:hypothetical protein